MKTLRIERPLWDQLLATLPVGPGTEVESAVLAFGRVAESPGRRVFVVDEVVEIPPGGYALREGARLRLRDEVLLGVLGRIRDRGTFVLIAHTHPFGPAGWSWADDEHEADVARLVRAGAPGAPLVSLLRHPEGWLGRVLTSDRTTTLGAGWVVGRPLVRIPLAPRQEQPGDKLDIWGREGLAVGREVPLHLRDLRVGVVGAGGLGATLVDGLARLGVGSLVVVDFDTVDDTNLSRLQNAFRADIDKLKVDTAADAVARIHPRLEVVRIRHPVQHPDSWSALATCDLVVLATDNHSSRDDGWAIAKTARSMVVSVGTDPQPDPSGKVNRVSAYVADLLPSEGCLLCNRVVDAERLRVEAMPLETVENERRDGYIPGVRRPAVLAWNLVAAGEALGRFVEIVADLPPAPQGGQLRLFELLSAADGRYRVQQVVPPDPRCPCSRGPLPESREALGARPGS